MSKFCNFCHCNDIDYQEIINKNFNSILENMYSPPNKGKVYVYGGMCEGCSMSGIVVSQKYDGVFEIHSADTLGDNKCGLIGKLVASNKKSVLIEKVKNYNHWLIEIDINSKLFKSFYHKKNVK
tara:strand:+ start:8700 stop:9071 length:372 start_codon:yes stop_codon:yes gene_type:complete